MLSFFGTQSETEWLLVRILIEKEIEREKVQMKPPYIKWMSHVTDVTTQEIEIEKSSLSNELSHVILLTTQEIKTNGDHQRGRRRACYAS